MVLEKPGSIVLDRLPLSPPDDADVVVDIDWSGISTGTERLLWSGTMPSFPGMGYPLVPGYESAGRIVEAGSQSGREPGQLVFVPGAQCYGDIKGLFGGASSRVVVPGARTIPVSENLGEEAVLLALAATAYHAITPDNEPRVPDLIVGHGVLGRLLARLAVLLGDAPPTVWERNADRREGAEGYAVVDPEEDTRRDYRVIADVSGDASLLDELISRLASGGEIVLAGFYDDPVQFAFPPAFMRRIRLRVAAEWREHDLTAVRDLAESGELSLSGLISHRLQSSAANEAYRTAFDDPTCLKMVLNWGETNE